MKWPSPPQGGIGRPTNRAHLTNRSTAARRGPRTAPVTGCSWAGGGGPSSSGGGCCCGCCSSRWGSGGACGITAARSNGASAAAGSRKVRKAKVRSRTDIPTPRGPRWNTSYCGREESSGLFCTCLRARKCRAPRPLDLYHRRTMSNVTDPYNYSLGTFERKSPGESVIRLVADDITAQEYEEIYRACTSIAALGASFDYKLVERNFLDLQSVQKFVTIILSLGREFVRSDHRQLGESLMTSVVNWLTSWSLFLDHTETDLKRSFGKSSPEVQRFKAVTNSAFDAKAGYRFTCKFRNYVLHCGLPLSSIEVKRPDATTGTRAKQSVTFVLDRDDLLRNYDDWGRFVKRDLKGMPPTFPLLPLALEGMQGLRDVYLILLDIRISEALSRCAVLERALSRIEETGYPGHPTIFRYQGDIVNRFDFTPTVFSAEAVRRLAQVASGSVPRKSLFKEPEEQAPTLDPARVRQQLRADNRGVQILSVWLAEKGASPAFIDAVNRIIAEDRSIQPLIAGVINTSALLAYMTAGAIGTTAQGLVADLLDAYGRFDEPGAGGSVA